MIIQYLTAALLFLLLLILSGIRMEQEYQRGVIFRLGRYSRIKGPGLYWIIPFIDRKVRIDIRTNTLDIESQETVTSDSVTIKVNAVLYFKIHSADRAIIEVKDYMSATYQAALTALRNVIGQNTLDDVLRNRSKINEEIKEIVDKITDAWGVTVDLIEMKDVEIPQTMQRAMAKEAEAMREKRARIIKAEAELESSQKLREAAKDVSENPAALELRRMQMISEVGVENNTTTIVLMPSEFVTLAKSVGDHLKK
ncbi:MAG: slipin family protein [Spirochaetales bacterium]|nr:slipin family protein [Spirochaetales bacterium]